jgi:hypothetical protein
MISMQPSPGLGGAREKKNEAGQTRIAVENGNPNSDSLLSWFDRLLKLT